MSVSCACASPQQFFWISEHFVDKLVLILLWGLVLEVVNVWMDFKSQMPVSSMQLSTGGRRGLWLISTVLLWLCSQHKGIPVVFLEIGATQTKTSFVQTVQLFWHCFHETTLWFHGESPRWGMLKISASGYLYSHLEWSQATDSTGALLSIVFHI